ncbi:hypothetical protein MMC13_005315 [Lambiella insularis]|nr:hypothetical protein [Lambiella insularis]
MASSLDLHHDPLSYIYKHLISQPTRCPSLPHLPRRQSRHHHRRIQRPRQRNVLELAQRGADVAFSYTSDSSTVLAGAVAGQVRNLGRKVCLVKADLAGLSCGKAIVEGTLKGLEVAKIDILVNNAAIGQQIQPMEEFTVEEYQRVMDTNVRGPLLLAQALIPHLTAKDARIINISSLSTTHSVPGLTMYATSKAALEALTRQ